MKFGDLDLAQREVDDLYLLLGHCSGKLANQLLTEMQVYISPDKEPDWDRVEPVVDIERSHIVQFELHLKGGE